MPLKNLYEELLHKKSKGKKNIAVLIDPDKTDAENLRQLIAAANENAVDYFFIGSSFLLNNELENCVAMLKSQSDISVVLFPGNHLQISNGADAILLLSLISGRNPELLIGQHVTAAPVLKRSRLEIISTGYMLIDGGVLTSASYISNTIPIPSDKNDIAVSTAMAGEMLGLKMLYLDAGSGAKKAVGASMIKAVSDNVQIPLIVGGGIRTPEKAAESCMAGADLIVVGNVLETEPGLLAEIAQAVHESSVALKKMNA